MIVMPGFIDTHRHIWEGILKNIAPDALLDEYFSDILGVLAPVYRPQDAYAGNLVSALGAIDCGVTTLLDWSHIQNTPEHTDAAISALQESGLRSVFAYGTPNLDMAAWWHDSSLKHPTDVKRVATQYFSSPDQLLTLALAPRGPSSRRSTSPGTIGISPARSASASACTSVSAPPASTASWARWGRPVCSGPTPPTSTAAR